MASKVVSLRPTGPILVSMDLHGHLGDFHRLRDIFLASEARGERPWWISVGDWVHGPTPDRHPLLDGEGAPLYDYPDDSAALVRELFALIDRFPGRIHSITGNHEHAHIGGMRTRKFHDDEAAFLEAQLSPAARDEMRARFRSWPMIIRLPAQGIVITHGAPYVGTAAAFDALAYDAAHDLMRAAMTRYGFDAGEDRALLDALSDDAPYDVLLHGHDREELGHAPTGPNALLVCTSFGARRSHKTYVWLDPATRYRTLADLREGIELRRLYQV